MAKVLVADDEPSICEAFRAFLRQEGHEALVAADGEEALRLIDASAPDAVFLDVRLPGRDGLSILGEIADRWPGLPVIVMTAFGTVETAVTAMRLDAFDYVGKPLDLGRLRQLLDRALAVVDPVGHPPPDDITGFQLIGQSPAMQEVFKQIGLLAANEMSVLIQGESGVGKELVARSIHLHGKEEDDPFVAVNCAAIAESLIESELFGHDKGAFTDATSGKPGRFERAAGGTLFLDEISELSLPLQGKLLRVLQEREFERVGGVEPIRFRARLIVASNRRMGEEVEEGRFREDLFHRLNLARIDVPPLRERREDIPLLVAHFVGQANLELKTAVPGVSPEAEEQIMGYPWPGNVRELENAIKRGAMTARSRPLNIDDLRLGGMDDAQVALTADQALRVAVRKRMSGLVSDTQSESGSNLMPSVVTEVEKELVRAALELTGGNQAAAARLLGISRTTLRTKMDTA